MHVSSKKGILHHISLSKMKGSATWIGRVCQGGGTIHSDHKKPQISNQGAYFATYFATYLLHICCLFAAYFVTYFAVLDQICY